MSWLVKCMVKTCESRLLPSPNLDKVTVSFDKLNNADLFLQIHGVYIVHTLYYIKWTSGKISHLNHSVLRCVKCLEGLPMK